MHKLFTEVALIVLLTGNYSKQDKRRTAQILTANFWWPTLSYNDTVYIILKLRNF